MISVLFVETNGIYFNDSRVDPWDVERDAFGFKGKNKVICHPPCKRWGRFWGGGPTHHGKPSQRIMGDDNNCFAHSLWAVRTFGGVIEHPEASHAWRWFGLKTPPQKGGWIKSDNYGGFTCCVAQGHYGHRAQKLTWLYAVDTKRPDLKWGKCENKVKLLNGGHCKEKLWKERRDEGYKPIKRISTQEMMATPKEFKELLISLLKTKAGQGE